MTEMCSICMCDSINLPIALSCHHSFCYLCIKRWYVTGDKKCPLCRSDIPPNEIYTSIPSLMSSYGQDMWAYAGRGGWWLYDPVANKTIVEAFTAKDPETRIDVGGTEFVVDFDQMVQFSSGRKKTRAIKRVTQQDTIKGIAGLTLKDEA